MFTSLNLTYTYFSDIPGNQWLAPILLESCEVNPNEKNARLYQNNVIGGLLALSVLPKSNSSMPEFFDNPIDQVCGLMINMTLLINLTALASCELVAT